MPGGEGLGGRLAALAPLTLLIAGFSLTRIADYDFWWHLNLGRQIFQAGTPVVADAFSYTFAGAPQFNGEWLADLSFFLAYDAGGFAGVALLKTALVLATFFVLYRTLMTLSPGDAGRWFLAVVLTLTVVLFALRFRLFIRPYLFSFLFLSLFLFLLVRFSKTGDARPLWLLPLIELLWANTSKGLFLGPLLVGVFVAGGLMNRRFDRRLPMVLAGVALASVCSPEGLRPYGFLLAFAANPALHAVGEQQALSPGLLWGSGWRYTAGYQLLVLGSLGYFLFQGGWRNGPRLLLFAAFFAASLLMIRMIGLFALVAGMFFVFPLHRLLQGLPDRLFQRPAAANGLAGVLLLALGGLSIPGNETYAFGIGPNENNIPAGAVAWLDREGIEGRIMNSYPFGGYIPWASPGRKVFIDGRINQLYPPAFHQGYFRIIEDADGWAAAERQWGFTVAVLEYDHMSLGRHFPLHLNRNPNWALVFWDGRTVVYLKRTPENQELIQRHGYRIIRPNFNDFSYLDRLLPLGRSKKMGDALERRIDLEAARNPGNQEARLARLFLLSNLGRLSDERMLQEIEATLAMAPDVAIEHSAAAYLYLRLGREDRAREEVARALALDPEDGQARALQARLR
ncbi:MAG TPA: hypothetical protein ENI99_00565 [Sedimenticola sp.]|nr:hypothetical protein [Sedimenticola sp.]